METENSQFYGYSEKTIKNINFELYILITKHVNFDIPFKQKFYLYEHKLSKMPTCYCGKGLKFIDMKNGFRNFCSKRCMYDSSEVKASRIKTCLGKYGVDNPSKAKIVKEKVKKTNLERFGVEFPLQSSEKVKKSKNVFLDKYGVDNPSKIRGVREKAENTMLVKFGVRHAMHNDDIKLNLKKYFLDKYQVDNPSKSELCRKKRKIGNDENYIKYLNNKISLFRCKKGHNFEILSDNYIGRSKINTQLCTICNPIGDSKSIKEKDLLAFIKENYNGEIIDSYRDSLEIDIYLPDLNIGFEFNGLYWHSNKFKNESYHLDKTNFFREKGIRIIHIWEDDWIFKKEIIQSRIINLLSKSEKIYARKCAIEEVSESDAQFFLERNHVEGFAPGIKHIGLYCNSELVSIMTFNLEKVKLSEWNLLRFCNKIGFNIIGGASKLLNYFIKNNDVSCIISYANRDWPIGNLYQRVGFVNACDKKPDYKYIVNDVRVDRSEYMKSKIYSTKEHRVYDCGKIKFILDLKSR